MIYLQNAHRILCQEAAIRIEHYGADERYSALASAIQDIEKFTREAGESDTLNLMQACRHVWLPQTENRSFGEILKTVPKRKILNRCTVQADPT